ncbi:MAG TPA: hypothetical protein VMW75_28820 [Thermoanaerobaculia bacterium]|nr:hypothetical protein [Thermoanaerobaculia bacterium]
MITGYNTDVRHNEVVFHVQTEDKGAANPFIESLVYVGGQVLASKRANYADLLAAGRDEKEIVALMDHQHRTMIAAIRHGKLDAKLAALIRPKTSPQPVLEQVPAGGRQVPAGAGAASRAVNPTATPRAVPVQAPPAERTLDQVILEYLTNEADQEQLVLVLEAEADLALGRRASLALRTSSSKSGQPIAGAQVSVRMISTIAEPRVLAVGRTDEYGGLPLRFEIPALDRGTAALIISAVSAIGRAELKHLL